MHPKTVTAGTLACFAILLLATGLIVSMFWQTASSRPFFYDEADYMYAGTRGFADNFLDRPSLSTAEFIRKGLQLAHDHGKRSNMSQFIRSMGDITFYRHYHGPVYAYWIALDQALGVRKESTYRASGLVIHAAIVILIFWFFRIGFPEYPPVAALAASLTFLMNRTALVADTIITQHSMFGLTSLLTLSMLALFCRTGNRRYWYLTAAASGVSFATVETSFVLVGAVVVVLALLGFGRGWKYSAILLAQGLPIFLGVILLIWPNGILSLGALKGYIYLGYMALSRKTFTPLSPWTLWAHKLVVYPEEFVIQAFALIVAAAAWKSLAGRMAVLPYLVYAWMFVAATLVITLPYTYYHVSLLVSGSVIVGVVFGEIWRRYKGVWVVAAAVLIASLTIMSWRYYRETLDVKAGSDPRVEFLSYIKSEPPSKTIYVPYVLVPTLHYYDPALTAVVGYDKDWQPSDFAAGLTAAGSNAEFFCESILCAAVGDRIKLTRLVPVMDADKEFDLGTLYSAAVDDGVPSAK